MREYQLVGGTAIALQIQHRLSDDLDFCKWVPDTEKPQYAVNPKSLFYELSSRFGDVQTNHLGFPQVNFLIENPLVKVTFYHTALPEPTEKAIPIIGNIQAIELVVENLPSEVARLRSEGLHFRNDIVTSPGGSQILLIDPSGNFVELFEPKH